MASIKLAFLRKSVQWTHSWRKVLKFGDDLRAASAAVEKWREVRRAA